MSCMLQNANMNKTSSKTDQPASWTLLPAWGSGIIGLVGEAFNVALEPTGKFEYQEEWLGIEIPFHEMDTTTLQPRESVEKYSATSIKASSGMIG